MQSNDEKLPLFRRSIFCGLGPLHWQSDHENVPNLSTILYRLSFPFNWLFLIDGYRCFFKASDAAKLDETMISFFWILFFFIRPVAMTIKHSPQIILSCHRQVQVLKHERELSINGKLLLYKDHHRRLFHVIFSSVFTIWRSYSRFI